MSKKAEYEDFCFSKLMDVYFITQNAPVVVVFGSSQKLRSLLAQLRAAHAQNTLTFVAGNEMWGRSQDFTGEYFQDAAGSLTIKLAASDDSGFNSNLQGMKLEDVSADVFLTEWFQQKLGCALNSNSMGRYSRICSSSDKVDFFYQSYAPYIINAVNMVAAAVNSALQSICPTVTGICSAFRTANVRQQIGNYVKSASGSFQMKNGEGISDLAFYNIKNGIFTKVSSSISFFLSYSLMY